MSDRVATVYTETFTLDEVYKECQLVVVDGPGLGRAIALGESVLVGSDATCDLVLSDVGSLGNISVTNAINSRVSDVSDDGTATDDENSGQGLSHF